MLKQHSVGVSNTSNKIASGKQCFQGFACKLGFSRFSVKFQQTLAWMSPKMAYRQEPIQAITAAVEALDHTKLNIM